MTRPKIWRVLAKAHEIRNRSEYEGRLDVTEGLVRDLVEAAELVLEALRKAL